MIAADELLAHARGNLKRFRAIATRYEKTARNYLALVQPACARVWLEDQGHPYSPHRVALLEPPLHVQN